MFRPEYPHNIGKRVGVHGQGSEILTEIAGRPGTEQPRLKCVGMIYPTDMFADRHYFLKALQCLAWIPCPRKQDSVVAACAQRGGMIAQIPATAAPTDRRFVARAPSHKDDGNLTANVCNRSARRYRGGGYGAARKRN